jgi:plastocyanin
VDIADFDFTPSICTTAVGSTVTWYNYGGMVHTVTSDGNFDSLDIAVGESWPHPFDTPGTYHYYCKKHTWMTGTIIVT